VTTVLADPKVNFTRRQVQVRRCRGQKLKSHWSDLGSTVSAGRAAYMGKTMLESCTRAWGSPATSSTPCSATSRPPGQARRQAHRRQRDPEESGNTRKDVVESKGTLLERLEGEGETSPKSRRVRDTVLADPKVNFDRGGKFKFGDAEVKKLKSQLVDLGSTVSGGPRAYMGKTMSGTAQGHGDHRREFDALLGLLKAALDKNGVKPTDADEVLKKWKPHRKDVVEK